MDHNQLPSGHQVLQQLRARAEKRQHLATQSVGDTMPPDAQRLVQEPQVHQIELEMQYEELLMTQATAEIAHHQYIDLYDFAPVGYFTLTAEGLIHQLNLQAAQLLGTVRQRLQDRRFALFVTVECRPGFQEFLGKTMGSDSRETCELELLREDGSRFFARLEGLAMLSAAGTKYCRLAVIDTTESRETIRALEASEARFRLLFEQSRDAILLIQNKHIIDCNEATVQLFNLPSKSELLGQHVSIFDPPTQPNGQSSVEVADVHLVEAMRRGWNRFEWLLIGPNGQEMWVEVSLTSFSLNGQSILHCIVRDITVQRGAREQLRREKEFSESLLDNSVDGIMAFDAQRRLTAWNKVMELNTRKMEAEVLGKDVFELFPHHREGPEGEAVCKVLAGERVTYYKLKLYGRLGHFESYFVPLLNTEGEVEGGLVLVRDVTERVRLAEEATQLKLRQQQEVHSAILTTQEEERKRIAEALHNGVGQLLYATKLNLENRTGGTFSREAALALLEEAIKATRTVSFELTPGILQDFGLKSALEEIIKRIPRSGLHVHLYMKGSFEELPQQLEVSVYRIVQELLNNIIKHAQAQEAFVHVVHEEGHVFISAEDDGVGFEPTQTNARHSGIGLTSIRNRVDLLAGTLSIDSRPDRGTIVSIELQVK
ncbi:PAS/PAC sensor signal transduction histidine kinase [Hymenobacter roseosalivarius DSM 11622]|uniref:histidine kinase n=1 Tax=Hymenobacter roseosalivarius DSM 11622 TaxID=645990 RepID=A0A1W1VZ41_9BACT|nr:PAS domain S-box protein [Hymenobacter roseosalivarius]SMB98618.1 PAS/PAC sensor signal transduction histidine kinase [Hymenobacter roseosalivarius DSM 11622]